MSPKTSTTYRIDDEILDALRQVKERDGIPVSEQVRRALLMWLESKGVKATNRRVSPRRKV
jgi:antitoxin component of RelBE/YafQ-DinJ toxin-antitoxin module